MHRVPLKRSTPVIALASLAFVLAFGNVATAQSPAPTPTLSPTPIPIPIPIPTQRLTVNGAGESLPTGTDGDPNGLLGYVASVARDVRFHFCASGSDAAIAAFAHRTPLGGACADAPPDFIAIDAPLRASDAARFGRAIVVVPFVASSVALVYDNPDVTGRLELSVGTLCKIAGGEIANWDRIPRDPANPAGPAYPHRALHFVVRADGTGETFALANFLSARDENGRRTCEGTGQTFGLSAAYADGVLPRPLPHGASRTNFLSARSEAAELACVIGAPGACAGNRSGGAGSIGYAGAAAATAIARYPLGLARLYVIRRGIPRDEDPIADLPGVATRLRAYAIGVGLANSAPNGRPQPELVPFESGTVDPQCAAVIPPRAYAFPPVGYPIVAVTELLFASDGNGERTIALRVLASIANRSDNFTTKRIRTIDPDGVSTGTTGYSVLPLSTNRKTGLPALIRCIGT